MTCHTLIPQTAYTRALMLRAVVSARIVLLSLEHNGEPRVVWSYWPGKALQVRRFD